MSVKLKTLFGVIIIIVVVIFFHYFGWLKPLENSLRFIIKPGEELVYNLSVKINDKEEYFGSVSDLKMAYTNLKEQSLNNTIDQTNLISLDQENNQLRSQLNFFKKKNFSYLGADVIGKNIEPLASTVVVNRGSNDGVKVGQAVILGEGILVGVIARVENESAIVRLINDNQSKIAASLLNKDKSIGIIEGGYGISIKMTFIPQNEQINVGDIIVTSGLQAGIPANLLIGTVEAVEKESYQPFQQAIIKPSASLDRFKLVSIIVSDS